MFSRIELITVLVFFFELKFGLSSEISMTRKLLGLLLLNVVAVFILSLRFSSWNGQALKMGIFWMFLLEINLIFTCDLSFFQKIIILPVVLLLGAFSLLNAETILKEIHRRLDEKFNSVGNSIEGNNSNGSNLKSTELFDLNSNMEVPWDTFPSTSKVKDLSPIDLDNGLNKIFGSPPIENKFSPVPKPPPRSRLPISPSQDDFKEMEIRDSEEQRSFEFKTNNQQMKFFSTESSYL